MAATHRGTLFLGIKKDHTVLFSEPMSWSLLLAPIVVGTVWSWAPGNSGGAFQELLNFPVTKFAALSPPDFSHGAIGIEGDREQKAREVKGWSIPSDVLFARIIMILDAKSRTIVFHPQFVPEMFTALLKRPAHFRTSRGEG